MHEKKESTQTETDQPKVMNSAAARGPLHSAGDGSATSTQRQAKKHPSGLVSTERNQAANRRENSSHERNDILLLYREQSVWELIEQAIDQEQWRYLSLSNFPALREALRYGVKVILIDASFLPEIVRQPLRLSDPRQEQPTLFFVSERCDVEIRIQALQAGADRLFSDPIDLTALIRTIGAVVQPIDEPKSRVLVIADDEFRAKPTVELLCEGSIETLILSEPLKIIDTIWRFRPDLILMLEPNSTHIDNIVLTKLIRDREESLATPIMFISDDEDPEKELKALWAGADDFLSRPIRPQLVLASVINRIQRVKAVSAAGVQIIEEHPVELSGRQAMLARLERMRDNANDDNWFYGLIVIALDPLKEEAAEHITGGNQNIATLLDGFGPILQAHDCMARIGVSHLAILIRRGGKKEVKRQTDLAFEIINYRLATQRDRAIKFGVGLVVITNTGRSADELLQYGEQAADTAYRQWREGHAHYFEKPILPVAGVKEGAAWQREEFIYALHSGSVTIQEQRYGCPGMGMSMGEIIELIPQFDAQDAPVDIYHQASLCRATLEFDRFVCDCGLQRLYDCTLQGNQVRLILRQSVAVLDEPEYIDFIKSILRRLHIVGNGLLLEFSLPSIVSRLPQTAGFFNDLAALGIGISLSHFPCNDAGVKLLLHVKPDVVRPRTSHLHANAEIQDIAKVINEIHLSQAEVVLPGIEHPENVSSEWLEHADFVQAELLKYEQLQGKSAEVSMNKEVYPGQDQRTRLSV
jgi:DNA-binding response OmpR family regulator/EAL domain-containing protein (putative c-di-GMP-specific phosphodiesterase class I)